MRNKILSAFAIFLSLAASAFAQDAVPASAGAAGVPGATPPAARGGARRGGSASTPFVPPAGFVPPTRGQIAGATPFFTVSDATAPTPEATAAAAATILSKPPEKLASAQILRLWPGAAPLQDGDDVIRDIPTMTVFLPPEGKATGASMVIFPGGGYEHISANEGVPNAQWMAFNGITSFVVKYRLGTKYHHPAELDDAQRAIRYVRANAKTWGLDPDRIGVMGFSAGGHLASTAATHFDPGDPQAADPIDRVSCRPDAQILLYPVMDMADDAIAHGGSRQYLLGNNASAEVKELLSNEKQVTAQTPPAFIVHSISDGTVKIANSDLYVAALMEHNIPFEYIREPIGGHGFGLTQDWAYQAIAWLHAHKF